MSNLPFNWVDIVFLIVLILGIHRGRKRGMSEELMPLLKWIIVLAVCAVAYEPLGMFLAQNSVLSKVSCYIIAYLGTAMILGALLAAGNKALGGKLVGSDVFGRSEYYLGMVAGLLRFACITLFVLALLNARLYTAAEVQQETQYQLKNYGSQFFATPQSIQTQVFQGSFLGRNIKKYLSLVLIKPTPGEKKQIKRKQFQLP